MKFYIKICAFLFFVLLPFCVFAAEGEDKPTKEWLTFLDNLKKEMISKGISKETIKKAYGDKTYYHPKPSVVAQDKNQAEFVLTSKDYLNKLVSADRVKNARKHYQKLKKNYQPLQEEYEVPLPFLTAFWAVETNFGQNKGKYHLIDGLTNLSYRNRRSDFFKNELYHVLKIMDKYDLSNEKMLGSWAGAMGHFQFMPSTYNAYAIDYDGDGVADIWDSFDDAIGSAANYLHALGWKKDQPWGEAVKLPWNFDYTLTGYQTTKSVKEWKNLGLESVDGKPLNLDDNLKASVIIPDGRKGQPYIVLANFRKIMIWNRSENYALAIGLLADYIGSQKDYQPVSNVQQYALTNQDILKIQKFANKNFRAKLKEDGKLGPKTKAAVKKIQAKAKLHQDGYPDYLLLKKIENYDPKRGFNVPVQPKKKGKSA